MINPQRPSNCSIGRHGCKTSYGCTQQKRGRKAERTVPPYDRGGDDGTRKGSLNHPSVRLARSGHDTLRIRTFRASRKPRKVQGYSWFDASTKGCNRAGSRTHWFEDGQIPLSDERETTHHVQQEMGIGIHFVAVCFAQMDVSGQRKPLPMMLKYQGEGSRPPGHRFPDKQNAALAIYRHRKKISSGNLSSGRGGSLSQTISNLTHSDGFVPSCNGTF